MKEPWSIKSRARECAESGIAFKSGQKIRAAIFPDPDSSGYLRKDFSTDAWGNREDKDKPFSTWITTYEPPVVEEKAEDVVDEDPETLLKRLVEEDEEFTENARYILAVMLERKKLLRETDTQEIPSGILRVYEHRKTGDVYIIKDPQIPLSDVDRVQEEVRQLLDPDPEPQSEAAEETKITEESETPEDSDASEETSSKNSGDFVEVPNEDEESESDSTELENNDEEK